MTTLRKLDELSYKQLKEELRIRELKIVGAKEKIRASLRQDLVDEGEDPETNLFEVEPNIGEVLHIWLRELCTFQDSMNHSMDKLICNVQGQINPTILPEMAEADSLLNSVASCGSTALSQVILRKGIMKRSSESTALTTTRAVTTTLCVRWLTPATTVKMERPRLRHRVERNLVNWRRR
ncbi:SAFB-like transcription modulator [Biomphalaria pfeifferi]|uniref:SAFB-like transcription modulator n=1 Tax=Biomphalaria pfeifferi TaxID=112525 RepID=A0AAD8F931_BIOPF|nr:SAFB-like transcription modulator [Biomphalaria pfeifferi]